jgi:Putative Ig domain
MMARILDCLLAWALVMAMGAAASGQAAAAEEDQTSTGQASRDQASPDKAGGLVIEPEELPVTYPQAAYGVKLSGRGDYVPTLHWRLESGALPPGITLDESGELRGTAERAGEFQFVVEARDGGKPQQGARRAFVIKVVEAITLVWKVPAHVTGNRIDGSVAVTNTTPDDMDLTFDAKAVAENGRATEIGYQHFLLKRGTVGMALPFGDTLPYGGYVVYVNVVGELAKRNAIYRQGMQTPGALQVVVGP